MKSEDTEALGLALMLTACQ